VGVSGALGIGMPETPALRQGADRLIPAYFEIYNDQFQLGIPEGETPAS